jgi:hypothetical protein
MHFIANERVEGFLALTTREMGPNVEKSGDVVCGETCGYEEVWELIAEVKKQIPREMTKQKGDLYLSLALLWVGRAGVWCAWTSKINGHVRGFSSSSGTMRAKSRLAVKHDSFPSEGQ